MNLKYKPLKMSFHQIIFLFLWITFSLLSNIQAQPWTRADSMRGAYHELRSSWDLNHYRLQLKIDPATRYISGNNKLTFKALTDFKNLQVDLDANFEISKIISPLGNVKWTRIGNAIQITLPQKMPAGTSSWIQVHYAGHPHVAANPPWDGGFVWHQDAEGYPWIGVACEGSGSSLWFPSKNHPADEPDSVLLQYEVPKNLVAVGNGQFFGKNPISDSTAQYSFRVTYPINHYNITLNVGPYISWSDTMTLSESGKLLQMRFHALPQDEAKARKQFVQSKQVVRVLSRLFGDYPFIDDGYQLVQTPYLGMEHQSCIAYGSKFQDNEFGFDFIVMHETGHEWWGNYTSANDHADMWIHESFCTYAEALYLEKIRDKETAIRYLLEQKKKIKNKSQVQGPRDVYFNGWKDADMYYKGNWMLHTLRFVVDDDALWLGWLKSIGPKFGLKPISGDELIAYASHYFGRNLKPFFSQYLHHLEWPVLEWRWKEKEKLWEYRWNCAEKEFQYPVEVKINETMTRLEPGKDWKSMTLESKPNRIEINEQQFLGVVKQVKN